MHTIILPNGGILVQLLDDNQAMVIRHANILNYGCYGCTRDILVERNGDEMLGAQKLN